MHRSWLQCTTLLHRCHTRMHQEALEILPQSYTSTALPVPTTPLPLTSHRRRMSCHGATFCKSGEISFTQMNMILWRWDIVYVFPFVLLSYVLWCWLCWWRRFSLLVARNRISVMKAASCARPISTGLQCRRWFNRLTMFNPLTLVEPVCLEHLTTMTADVTTPGGATEIHPAVAHPGLPGLDALSALSLVRGKEPTHWAGSAWKRTIAAFADDHVMTATQWQNYSDCMFHQKDSEGRGTTHN